MICESREIDCEFQELPRRRTLGLLLPFVLEWFMSVLNSFRSPSCVLSCAGQQPAWMTAIGVCTQSITLQEGCRYSTYASRHFLNWLLSWPCTSCSWRQPWGTSPITLTPVHFSSPSAFSPISVLCCVFAAKTRTSAPIFQEYPGITWQQQGLRFDSCFCLGFACSHNLMWLLLTQTRSVHVRLRVDSKCPPGVSNSSLTWVDSQFQLM